MPTKIAIIGAGLSGLTLATQLKDSADVRIFEKSLSVGGRMATREANGFSFDHGAQYFSVKSVEFSEFIRPYIEQKIVQEWHPRIVEIDAEGGAHPISWNQPRYVASPSMRSLCEALADDLNVDFNSKISTVERRSEHYWITDENSQQVRPFDWVITTTPSCQALELIPKESILHSSMTSVQMKGCYALMLGFDRPITTPWDAAVRPKLPAGGSVSWVSVNSSKPDRGDGFSIVAQSSNDWANERLDEDQNIIIDILLDDVQNLLGFDLPARAYEELHKWRFANVSQPANKPFLMDREQNLAACGDWCLHGKVEAAFLNAHALAKQMRTMLD